MFCLFHQSNKLTKRSYCLLPPSIHRVSLRKEAFVHMTWNNDFLCAGGRLWNHHGSSEKWCNMSWDQSDLFSIWKVMATARSFSGAVLLQSPLLKWWDSTQEAKHYISSASLTFRRCSYALLIVVHFQHLINYLPLKMWEMEMPFTHGRSYE